MTRSPTATKQVSPRIRWLTGLVGLAALIAGQVRMAAKQVPAHLPLKLGVWLNEQLHLGIPTIDSILTGLPLLIVGGLLLALAIRGLPLLPKNPLFKPSKPFSWRTLARGWYWILAGVSIFGLLLARMSVAEVLWYRVPLWLIALGIFAYLAFQLDRKAQIDLSPHLTHLDLLWMLGLILVGLLIGTFRLEGFPDQLVGDEGNFWTIARDIANGIYRPSIFGFGVYTFPIFSSSFQACIMRLFSIDLWGWRISSVLTGLLTVPPLYMLAREAFNHKVAIATSAILVTSPYFLAFSRLGYNNIQALFITTLAFYWMYSAVRRKSNLYMYLAGCAAGVGFYVYFSARLVIIAMILFLILLWLTRSLSAREAFRAGLITLLAFLLVMLPHLVYGAHHDPQSISYKTFESVFFNSFNGQQFYTESELYSVAPPFEINGNELFYQPRIYMELIVRGFLRTMLAFQTPWIISEHYIAFALAGTIGVFFYLIGLALVAWTFKQPRSMLLSLWFLMNVFGLSALNTVPPRHTHIVSIIPVLAMLSALGAFALMRALAALFRQASGKRSLILSVIVLAMMLGGLWDYFIQMPRRYQPHPDQVILWTGLNLKDEGLAYVFTDPSEAEFMPDLVSEYRRSVTIQAIPFAPIKDGLTSFSTDKPSIVFFPPEIGATMNAVLQKAWGKQFIGKSFYNPEGKVILQAGMNTPFVFEQDKPLSTLLNDTYGHGSLLVLIGGLVLLLFAIATYPTHWRSRIPTRFLRPLTWIAGPGEATEFEEPEYSWIQVPEAEEAALQPESTEPPAWAQQTLGTDISPNCWFKFDLQTSKNLKSLDINLHVRLPRWKNVFQPDGMEDDQPALLVKEIQVPQPLLFIAAVLSAVAAQSALSFGWLWVGLVGYLGAAVGLLAWAIKNPKWRSVFPFQIQIKPHHEALLFSGMLFLMAIVRYYDLGYRVYGLEADETKWTVQSWYSTILRVNLGEFASMHYDHVPVDFWVRSAFLRLFGLNFISARIESATLSLISVLLLYFIFRLITRSSATALLGSALYGLSFIELNASHQALHNTPVEPWMMGGILFGMLAITKRAAWKFQISGLFLALGMLTYETFLPTVILVLLYMVGMAFYEIHTSRESVRNWLLYLALTLWPVVLVFSTFTNEYLTTRNDYIFGWFWTFSERGDLAQFFLKNFSNLIHTLFVEITYRDSLLNWAGPLISPWLLPFVAIGFIFNLWNFKKPGYRFVLLWFFLEIIPGPVVTGSVWPRVLFTATAPLMLWGALGLWLCLAALRIWFKQLSLRLAAPFFAIIVVGILVNNYVVFTSALNDPEDRQVRRELADLTASSARDHDLLLLPYTAYLDEAAELESHVILFSVASAKNVGLEAEDYYQRIEYSDLLRSLWENKTENSIAVVVEKTIHATNLSKFEFMQAVLNCYPLAGLGETGQFFDVYTLNSQALLHPECFQPNTPVPAYPIEDASLSIDAPIKFAWQQSDAPTTSFSLQIDRKLEEIYWLEAETTFQGSGWYATSDFVKDFNGRGFLVDDWQSGRASYLFNAPKDAPYRIWVRYYKRRNNDQKNYFNLRDQSIEFAETGSPLDQWVWRDLGVFDLKSGQTPLGLSRTYGQDEQYSVFIDSVFLTPDLDFDPEFDSIWETVFQTDEVQSNATDYLLPQVLPSGYYRWKVRIFDQDKVVNAQGERGLESSFAEFNLTP